MNSGEQVKLDPDAATNVVLTAASILRVDTRGTPQIIHYDEGVGTGLVTNVREAYL